MSNSSAYYLQEDFKPSVYNGDEPYIFVGYARAEKERVYKDILAMQEAGFRIWYDRGIPATQNYKTEIVKKIKNAARVVMFVSPISVGRPEWKKELNTAANHGKIIIPVYLAKTTLPEEVEYDISAAQSIFSFEFTNEANYYKELFNLLPAQANSRIKKKESESPRIKQKIVRKNPRQHLVKMKTGDEKLAETKEKREPALKEGQPDFIFGGFRWRVLEVDRKNNKALLLTDKIIAELPYNKEQKPIDWENCSLRKHLNTVFLHGEFTEEERKRICFSEVPNPRNPWYPATPVGKPTQDYIFLLSITEVFAKLSGGGTPLKGESGYPYFWNDENNAKRSTKFGNNAHWWWLRSPGAYPIRAARVGTDGDVTLNGSNANNPQGGVRAALWLNLES
jgi:hypothetical protein